MPLRLQKSEDRGAFVALVAFAVAMYAVPGEWIEFVRPWRVALATSSLAVVLLLWGCVQRRRLPTGDGVRGFSLVGLLALAALSSLWSVFPSETQRAALEFVKLAAIYFTLVQVVTSWRRLQILCGAMVLSSIVTSIGVIHWKHVGVDLVEGFRARWVGVYADPNHMAMDLAIVVPLGIAFAMRPKFSFLFRMLCAAAAGLAVAAMVLSYSRGGFLGLLLGMAVWALRQKRKLQTVAIGLALAFGLAVWAPSRFWSRTQTVATFEEDASAMGRVYAWQVAANINRDRPLLGVGFGAFRFAWPLYAPPEARRAYVAHNVFLDVLGELGLLGMLLFLMFVGSACAAAFKAKKHGEESWLATGISASMASYLVCDLFSGYLLSSHFYILMGLGACVERLTLTIAPSEVPVHPALSTGG